MNNNSFLLNTNKYDHNDQFLHFLMNEEKYCYNILVKSKYFNPFQSTKIESLNQLKPDYNKSLNDCILIDNKHLASYGLALVNKFSGFNTIVINPRDNHEDVSEKIFIDSKNNTEYHNRLNNLNRNLSWFITTYQKETLTLPFMEAISELQDNNKLINNLPNNPYIGNTIFSALIDKTYSNIDENKKLYKLKYGKFNERQFARSVVGIGYVSDDNNIIQNKPITGTLLGGLTEEQFFDTCYGSRKGIVKCLLSL